jgi:hypothetical protein
MSCHLTEYEGAVANNRVLNKTLTVASDAFELTPPQGPVLGLVVCGMAPHVMRRPPYHVPVVVAIVLFHQDRPTPHHSRMRPWRGDGAALVDGPSKE